MAESRKNEASITVDAQWVNLFKMDSEQDLLRLIRTKEKSEANNWDVRDDQGRNALMFAAYRGLSTVVSELLRIYPESAGQMDENGCNALVYAFTANQAETAQKLWKDTCLNLSSDDYELMRKVLLDLDKTLFHAIEIDNPGFTFSGCVAGNNPERKQDVDEVAFQLKRRIVIDYLLGETRQTMGLSTWRDFLKTTDSPTQARQWIHAVMKSWVNGDNSLNRGEVTSLISAIRKGQPDLRTSDLEQVNDMFTVIGALTPLHSEKRRALALSRLRRLVEILPGMKIKPEINLNDYDSPKTSFSGSMRYLREICDVLGNRVRYQNRGITRHALINGSPLRLVGDQAHFASGFSREAGRAW